MVFSDLCFGPFDGGALRNDLGEGLSSNSMSQRKGRAVSRGVLLSAVAVGLATLTKARGQKTGAQVLDTGQTRDELITLISECLQGNGHRSLLSDRHYKLSDKKRKPQPNPSRLVEDFYVVRPASRLALKPTPAYDKRSACARVSQQ
jgi:plasmid replication initiation protein